MRLYLALITVKRYYLHHTGFGFDNYTMTSLRDHLVWVIEIATELRPVFEDTRNALSHAEEAMQCKRRKDRLKHDINCTKNVVCNKYAKEALLL